jgi:hypothetical protein
MERITAAREASQPIREKTGGSTFKNPPGHKAWQLIDAAGCRGLVKSATRRSRRCTATSSSTAARPRRRHRGARRGSAPAREGGSRAAVNTELGSSRDDAARNRDSRILASPLLSVALIAVAIAQQVRGHIDSDVSWFLTLAEKFLPSIPPASPLLASMFTASRMKA